MQRRKTFRKKRVTRRENRPHGKSKFGFKKGSKMFARADKISFMSPSQMPIAPRYRCKFHCDIQGAVPVGVGVASGHYTVLMNGLSLPFSSGTWPSAVPAIATLNPTGYTQLCSTTLYNKFRVFASKIEVQFLPQALADTINVTVTPSLLNTIPSSTQTGQAQPFTKQKMFSASQYQGKLINTISQHRLIGVTKRAIQDDLSGSYDSTSPTVNPSIPLYWVLNWSTPDAANIATPLNYTIKMVYYCELFDLSNANLVET